jgi:prohibitin 2
LSPSVDKPYSF